MRRNTRKLKQVLVTSTLLLGMLAIGGASSQAALQANPTTHNAPKGATGPSWIQSIRKMETTGNTMGLNEMIGSNLVGTSDSNGIDVHMMKTTEYGAMAILSASGFGNPKKLQESTVKSTTGNVTGVYVLGNRWEWTAGVGSTYAGGKDARYYDLYTTSQASAKVGDVLECPGWHGASDARWLGNSSCGFVCGNIGMFSFTGTGWGDRWDDRTYCGRGVAVVGSGL